MILLPCLRYDSQLNWYIQRKIPNIRGPIYGHTKWSNFTHFNTQNYKPYVDNNLTIGHGGQHTITCLTHSIFKYKYLYWHFLGSCYIHFFFMLSIFKLYTDNKIQNSWSLPESNTQDLRVLLKDLVLFPLDSVEKI